MNIPFNIIMCMYVSCTCTLHMYIAHVHLCIYTFMHPADHTLCVSNCRGVLSCSCSHEMMKILFVDNCSQETDLANVSIRCSNPPQGERTRASNRNVGKIRFCEQFSTKKIFIISCRECG